MDTPYWQPSEQPHCMKMPPEDDASRARAGVQRWVPISSPWSPGHDEAMLRSDQPNVLLWVSHERKGLTQRDSLYWLMSHAGIWQCLQFCSVLQPAQVCPPPDIWLKLILRISSYFWSQIQAFQTYCYTSQTSRNAYRLTIIKAHVLFKPAILFYFLITEPISLRQIDTSSTGAAT